MGLLGPLIFMHTIFKLWYLRFKLQSTQEEFLAVQIFTIQVLQGQVLEQVSLLLMHTMLPLSCPGTQVKPVSHQV
jgi:hypothetical protein